MRGVPVESTQDHIAVVNHTGWTKEELEVLGRAAISIEQLDLGREFYFNVLHPPVHAARIAQHGGCTCDQSDWRVVSSRREAA